MTHLDESLVLAFVAGRLSATEAERVEAHFDRCADCRDLVTSAAKSSLASGPAPAEVVAKAQAEIDIAYDKTVSTGDEALADTVASERADGPEEVGRASTRIGEVFGRYTIVAVLGEGAMGVVYAAHDSLLDRQVALKVVASDLVASAAADMARSRLLREAQTAARLSHPNVVTVYDAGAVGSEIFIAMELVEGESLATWLTGSGRSKEAILELFVQAGRGLVAAHEAGLVHRDFKPANVIVGKDGRARVADFGLAGWLDDPDAATSGLGERSPSLVSPAGARRDLALTRAGTILGTPRYMAPEQHRGERAGPGADQFSFAVSLYEALYESLPYEGETMDALAAAKSRGPKAAPPVRGVSKTVRAALVRALSPSVRERFPSMRELVTAISPSHARRTRAWIVALGATSVVLAGVGYGATVSVAKRQALCSGGEARVTAAWDPVRRTRVKEAFLHTRARHAEETWTRVEQELDRYAASWATAHREACAATRVRAEQSEAVMDLRMACLEQRRRDFDAHTSALAEADEGTVDRALSAVTALAPVTTCDDVRTLIAKPKGPVGPEVDAVRNTVATGRALAAIGKYKPAYERANEAAEAAKALGHTLLESEAFSVRGFAQIRLGTYAEAAQSYERAADRAQAGGDDRQVAEAQAQLVFAVGYARGNLDEGQSWARRAAATLERIGGDADLESSLESSISSMLSRVGRYDEAEVHARIAVEKLAHVQRPNAYVALHRATLVRNLAFDLMNQGKLDEARIEARRALELSLSALGPLHPEVAEATSILAGADIRAGDVAASLVNYEKSLALFESQLGPDNIRVGVEVMNLSEPLKRLHRFVEAMRALERAARIFEAVGNARLLASVHERKGEVFAEMKDSSRAEESFRLALPILDKDANPLRAAEARVALGKLLIERRDFNGAVEVLHQAVVALEKGHSADVGIHVEAVSQRGHARVALGQVALGLADLERAVALGAAAPDALETAHARLALADVLARRGDERAKTLASAARPALVLAKDEARLAVADRIAQGR